jgi:predicted O-linked N-acetylglucosamine transferase (SPINDLY family)/thioredoxin-like negative regulator of GroEL
METIQINHRDASPPAAAPADGGWLQALLREPAPDASAPWMGEALRLCLGQTPFEALVAAIEEAGGGANPAIVRHLYQVWIAANAHAPLLWAAWFNLATLLAQTGDKENALTAYGNAQILRPGMLCVALNHGLALEGAGRADEALGVWASALQPEAERVALLIQLGRTQETLGRFAQAEVTLRRVLQIDPAQPDVVHHWVHLRQKTCLWPAIPADMPGLPPACLLAGSGPLGILALSDDIALQAAAARSWAMRKTVAAPVRLAPALPYDGHERVRIGYLSSDYCSHAMSYLIAELFERHDRARFEVYGYCATLEDGSAVRQRVLAAFDHVRRVRDLTDEAAARLIREDEIDILVDLNGITDGSRIALLRWRPAPIQATYLGFIGPVPLPELDYVFCDGVTVPPEYAGLYEPRPLPIGPVYQVNDSRRVIAGEITRAQAGLPESGFVFCCFTKHFKITAELFAGWMRILAAVPGAWLWLAGDNEASADNLRAQAGLAGIDPGRLIFTERADPDTYMKRLAVADLFLDTFPYNAGTVASDALRMGLPLITRIGQSFASRMAASLLLHMGAASGIAASLDAYVGLAINLATDAAAYAAFRARFAPPAWARTLGDTAAFTRHYEAALLGLMPAAAGAAAAVVVESPAPLAPPPPAAPPAALPAAKDVARARQFVAQARHQEAIDAFCAAIAAGPDSADAYAELAALIYGLGQRQEAISLFVQALVIDPAHEFAAINLGQALHDAQAFAQAEAVYRAARAHHPQNATIALNLGAVLLESSAWEEAQAVTAAGLAIAPQAAMGHANHATALLHLARYDEALAAARVAIRLGPSGAAMHASLGGVMLELGEMQAARALCTQALRLDPDMSSAWFNLSHAHKALGAVLPAVEAARRAVALAPAAASYEFHLAHLLLLQGDLPAGFAAYEARWRLPGFAALAERRAGWGRPEWRGEPIEGKTLLVYTEQGLGDIIQFARFLPIAAQKAWRVILAVHPPVRRLLGTIDGVEIVGLSETLPDFDVQCALMSLGAALGTRLETIPAESGYLRAEPALRARWARRLPGKGLRVGIVWAGNPAVQRDRFRSPGLAAVAPLFALPGVVFVALQVGPGRAAQGDPLPDNVLDLGGEIGDLADTAAIMAELDLVVSSCTAPLHLAGALGVLAWGMIPAAPHFTWCAQGEASPWYPSIKLYRQETTGRDWSGVMARIGQDLAALAQVRADKPRTVRRPLRARLLV